MASPKRLSTLGLLHSSSAPAAPASPLSSPPPARRMFGSITLSSNKSIAAAAAAAASSFSSPPTLGLAIGEDDHSKLGTTVRQILDHAVLGRRFRAFAHARRCGEGLDFLDDLARAASSSSSSSSVHAACQQLYATYFADNAERAVNLSNAASIELLQRVHALAEDDDASSAYDVFEDAMYEVFDDIKQSDTLRAFCREDEEARLFANDASVSVLLQWLSPEHSRLAFSACAPQQVHLVRFCCAVNELERAAPLSAGGGGGGGRKRAAQELASKYLSTSSPSSIGSHVTLGRTALSSSFSRVDRVLADCRMDVLRVLAENEHLVSTARRSLALQSKAHRVLGGGNTATASNKKTSASSVSSASFATNQSSSSSTLLGGASSSARPSFIQLNAAWLLESTLSSADKAKELVRVLNTRTAAPPTIWRLVNQIRFCELAGEYFRQPSVDLQQALTNEFFAANKSSRLLEDEEEEDIPVAAAGGGDDSREAFDHKLNAVFDKVLRALAEEDEVMEALSDILLLRANDYPNF